MFRWVGMPQSCCDGDLSDYDLFGIMTRWHNLRFESTSGSPNVQPRNGGRIKGHQKPMECPGYLRVAAPRFTTLLSVVAVVAVVVHVPHRFMGAGCTPRPSTPPCQAVSRVPKEYGPVTNSSLDTVFIARNMSALYDSNSRRDASTDAVIMYRRGPIYQPRCCRTPTMASFTFIRARTHHTSPKTRQPVSPNLVPKNSELN